MALDLFSALTVLPPPSGARVVRDLVYMSDARGPLRADVYRPSSGSRAPAVFLVNGDAPEEVIARAKDWGVYRSYGEHLAARGLVGVPFNHRSREAIGGTMGDATRALAASVRAVIEFTRSHESDLRIDPEKVGVWVFSAAGPFGLAPLLRESPAWLCAVAGFYTIWDLAPYRDLDDPPAEEEIREGSCTTALDADVSLPRMFVARAGKDAARISKGTDAFIARALERNCDVVVHNHAAGGHGFDIRDDDDRSREIIEAALEFFVRALR